MRPPNPVPIPDARMIPARCLQLPPMGKRHSSLSSMPTVNHCLIGVLFFSLSKYFKEFTGTPNPMAPPDLIVSIAMTSPDWFITGLPLLPASMGMATWIIGRPSPNSSSRTAETTPLLMLNPYPRGLPMDRIVSPSLIWSELPSEMGCRSALSTLKERGPYCGQFQEFRWVCKWFHPLVPPGIHDGLQYMEIRCDYSILPNHKSCTYTPGGSPSAGC